MTLGILLSGCVTGLITEPQARTTQNPLFDAQLYEKVAVVVIDRTGYLGKKSGVLRQVEDEFVQELVSKGYALATRSDIDTIISESELSDAGLTEEVVGIGTMLGANAVLLVSVNDFVAREYTPIVSVHGRQYYEYSTSLSARILDTERAQILWISSYTGRYQSSGGEVDAQSDAIMTITRVISKGLPKRTP